MTDSSNGKAVSRLTKVTDFLTLQKTATTIPFDPDCTKFPSRKDLPVIEGAPVGAAWVWGEDDQLGRLNLLTPHRVAAAAKEIKTVPSQPAFGREVFSHKIKDLGKGLAFDDIYELNTQSGTQWDGFRHIAHTKPNVFYNGVTTEDINGANANLKNSIHSWAEHGIAGRGVLLDYRTYAESTGNLYDPSTNHAIPYAELHACGLSQGLDIRPASQGGSIQIGDILLIRTGFVQDYNRKAASARDAAALRGCDPSHPGKQLWAGVSQEEAVVDWLHDCYFSAVAGDAPAFECWPAPRGTKFLHEYILALWGMPLGEMWDLERLSRVCREKGRWTFFVTSSPANCLGGVGSHANAQAIF